MVNLLEPQEIEVFYILPAIRRELTINLKNLGLKQKEIAKLLYVTSAAVSQYLNSKRASQVKFTDEIKQEVKNSALKIKQGGFLLEETQYLLNKVRFARITCQIHEKLSNIPKNCEVCFQNNNR